MGDLHAAILQGSAQYLCHWSHSLACTTPSTSATCTLAPNIMCTMMSRSDSGGLSSCSWPLAKPSRDATASITLAGVSCYSYRLPLAAALPGHLEDPAHYVLQCPGLAAWIGCRLGCHVSASGLRQRGPGGTLIMVVQQLPVAALP
jgi:hypothetical protein